MNYKPQQRVLNSGRGQVQKWEKVAESEEKSIFEEVPFFVSTTPKPKAKNDQEVLQVLLLDL